MRHPRVLRRVERASITPARAPKPFRWMSQDESGGITVFVLVLFTLMCLAAGMAVDWQRYEMTRADLQDALDRGVLAATNINQVYDTSETATLTLDEQAEQLISEYMASRNFVTSELNLSVTVTQLPGGRQISASADEPVDTIFLRLAGLFGWDVGVSSTAIQQVGEVEIVLVLDVSYSMNGRKLDDLKVAAKDFLDTVLNADGGGRTLISIVPFSQQVNLPTSIADQYNFARWHSYSSCFDIHSLDFSTTAMPLSTAVPYRQYQHYREEFASSYGCPHADNEIMLYSNDLLALQAKVDAMRVENWTAMYMGMKWGAALLDPTSRPILTSVNTEATFAGWPHDWNDTTVKKFVVLMSDGANTRHHEIYDTDPNHGEPSPYSPTSESYCVYEDYSLAFWDQNTPPFGCKYREIDDPSNAKGEGDILLQTICNAVKTGANTTIYTIGFEVSGSSDAKAALQDCASSPATYYEVDGIEISTAFQNIADSITTLKLIN